MKILLFSSLFPNAAQPNLGLFVETRLRQTMRRSDLQAHVVAPVPWFPFSSPRFGSYAKFAQAPASEVRDGLRIEHPRYFVIPKVGMSLTPRLMYRGALQTVMRLCAEQSFDLIDAHYFYPDGVAAAMLAKRLELPLVITGRGTDLNVIPDYPRPRAMILAAARQAAELVTVSQALKDRLVSLGVPQTKVTVLRNGVDLERFQPLDREACRQSLGLAGPLILCVGNLVSLKGHDLVIRAMQHLPGLHLAIVGGGPLRGDLENLIASLRLTDRVRLVGQVPQAELKTYYSAADALVLASSREGWANVLLESMACGTPVAATPVSGTAELITEPAAGRIIAQRSVEAIVETLKDLLSNPPARADTRAVAEGFSWDEVVEGQLAVFRRAAKSS